MDLETVSLSVPEFVQDNDLLMLFGAITLMAALSVIIYELINFIPSFMLSVVNKMKNKTLSDEGDSLEQNYFDTSLEQDNGKLNSLIDNVSSLNKSDWFTRRKNRK